MAIKLKRRTLLLGGIAGAAGITAGLRPTDLGENHAPYFTGLSSALDTASASKPTLVVDKAQLMANIDTLTGHIGQRFHYRIVAKSLPSIGLLETIMAASGSDRLMLFHQPFLSQVASTLPKSDILMGKPMPVNAAKAFYQNHQPNDFNPQTQLQWLLDSQQRLEQYAELADELDTVLQINIEIDVGLHRGGVQDDDELVAMLELIKSNPRLQFAGLMGYEPHIVKVPGDTIAYRDKAMAIYQQRIDTAKNTLGEQWPEQVTLNAGGSPTYQIYDEGEFPFNELSAGSCLVKPTDFDLPSLADHQPASYIATPVLKVMDSLQIPGINIGGLMSGWDTNRRQTFFTYGGYWKALPESPKGLSFNPVYGRSTNQEMLNGSNSIALQQDDWVFLRPTQSEFVFVQFGDIAVYEQGQITDYWPVLAG